MTPHGYPADQYHCLLDEQPYYLVPQRLLAPLDEREDLIVNPACSFSWQAPLPADKAMRTTFADQLCPSNWIVWVDDPATLTMWPYWVGPEFFDLLSALAPGYPAPPNLAPEMRYILMTAGILVPPTYAAWRRRRWLDQLASWATCFERGYVNTAGLIPPLHLGALRRYYRHQVRAGAYTLGDVQVPHRFAAHGEPVARFFHHQLETVVGDIARTTVRPSYAYMVAYQSGAELTRHTDRAQCEYSVTLCIDATPEPEAQSPWPIQIETSDGALKIWQSLGDGLVYRGCYVPHSRDRLPEGQTSTSLLFHYVDEWFSGPLS